MHCQDVEIRGEPIRLFADRAAFWARERMLFAADLHLGKAAAFRSAGVPIPHGSTGADLARLTGLLQTTKPARLVILGDFLHARDGRVEKTFSEFAAWRRQHAELEVILVRGNHDFSAGDPPDDWNIRCVNEPYSSGPFVCVHHSRAPSQEFVFQGHLHPKVLIGSRGRGGKRFPCFVLEANRLLFPAFGSFTGGVEQPFKPGMQRFAIIEGEIHLI